MKKNQETNPYESVGCTDYVNEQQAASAILESLIARGAKFYTYEQQDILFLNGRVIDLFYSADIRDVLINTLKIPRSNVNKRLRERVRNHPLRQEVIVPVGTIGTVNGINEPKPRVTQRLTPPVRRWLQAVLNSNIPLGVQNEN